MRGVQALKVTFIRRFRMALTKLLGENKVMFIAALFGTALSVMSLSTAWALPASPASNLPGRIRLKHARR